MQAEKLKDGKRKPFLGNSLTIKTKTEMKKNLFMVAAVALFAAVSCNDQLSQDVTPAGETVTFEASVDGADTKVSLEGKVSKWENGDKITIHNGTKGYEFSTTDAGTKATFSYTGADFSGEKFMAVYPSGNYTADVEARTVTGYIPTYQPSRENDFSAGAVPSVAYTETQALAFKNAATLLKFTVKGTNVKGLVFYGNNNEAVSGNILVSLNEDNTIKSIVPQETTNTENDVTETKLITWAKVWAQTDNWCFNEGVTYYLAVVPQNFEKGFTVQLEVDGVGTKDVKKLETAYELKPNTIVDLGELEYVAPVVTELVWGVCGTMTNWADNADLSMELEGDWYVAKNVTLEADSAFKFRANGSWGTNRGLESDGTLAADTEAKVCHDGKDIVMAVPAVYDLYLSKNADKVKAVKVADLEVEEPSDEPVASEWGIVGDLNNWGDTGIKDVVMYSYKGMYVAYNVNFTADGAFKLRKGNAWNNAYNYGLSSTGTVTSGKYYSLISGSGSQNILIGAGTYDVWFDLSKKLVYILEPGSDPETAVKGTPVAPLTDKWYLVGEFNGWKAADSKYQMTAEGTWYVFKNFNVSGQVKFVADANWNVNRGGSWKGENKQIALSQGGSNINVQSGTYDVYLSSDAKYAYFMTPGSVPAN